MHTHARAWSVPVCRQVFVGSESTLLSPSCVKLGSGVWGLASQPRYPYPIMCQAGRVLHREHEAHGQLDRVLHGQTGRGAHGQLDRVLLAKCLAAICIVLLLLYYYYGAYRPSIRTGRQIYIELKTVECIDVGVYAIVPEFG